MLKYIDVGALVATKFFWGREFHVFFSSLFHAGEDAECSQSIKAGIFPSSSRGPNLGPPLISLYHIAVMLKGFQEVT